MYQTYQTRKKSKFNLAVGYGLIVFGVVGLLLIYGVI